MTGAASAALAPAVGSGADREGWRWPSVLGAFALSRLVTLVAAGLVAAVHHHRIELTFRVLATWDGFWYLNLAKHGYPHAVPPGSGQHAASTLAFFPLYPLLVRLVHAVLPVSWLTAGLIVSWAAGAAATLAVWRLARLVMGDVAGDRAAVAFAFFPGAFVLSMAYAEGLMILLAALCLHALLRRRWVVAGVAAALATATRPNALALVAACAVAGWMAWRATGERRAARAIMLAPAGAAAFFVFLWVHTGSPLTWFHAEHAGWQQGTDFGLATMQTVGTFLLAPFHNPQVTLVVATLAGSVVLARLVWRQRLPLELVVYTATVLFLCFGSSSLGGRPRFVLAAFPLVFPLARLPRRAFAVWMVLSTLGMAFLLWFAGTQLLVAS